MGCASRLIVVALLAGIAFVACGRPPLRVSQQERSIVIDMQSFGEYPTDVERLRVIDASRDEVIWEVKGRNEPQLGRVQLKVGENSVQVSDVRHGAYDVITPVEKTTFTIAPGARYVIEAWGSESKPGTKRSAQFVTPSS